MNFDFTEEQGELRELARRIFTDLAGHEQQRRWEKEDGPTALDRLDPKLWSALADAGLLGLVVPEDLGGAGLGLLEACIVADEAGRAAAPAPVTTATILGALPLARFGTSAVKAQWLAKVASGEAIVTSALTGPCGSTSSSRPAVATATAVVASPSPGGGYKLRGVLDQVPAGMVAQAVIVPAVANGANGANGADGGTGGTGLFLVELSGAGISRARQEVTDGRVEAEFSLDDVEVPAERVLVAPGPAGDEALQWCRERAMAAMSVEISGACRAALDLTARYSTERVQFDKPIATFQAVGQRAADAYIDTEAVRLTAWHAVSRLDQELPASAEVAVAAFWADDGAQRVVHAAQHIHGGVGVDRDYPVHRYYLLVKHLAPAVGGATGNLLELGALLAASA